MVHGGVHAVMAYQNGEIVFRINPNDYVDVLTNTHALAQLAMIGIANLSSADSKTLNDIYQEPHKAMRRYSEFVAANF